MMRGGHISPISPVRGVRLSRKRFVTYLERDRRGFLADDKLADSMKRFTYLLGQTELFQHFIDLKVCLIQVGYRSRTDR